MKSSSIYLLLAPSIPSALNQELHIHSQHCIMFDELAPELNMGKASKHSQISQRDEHECLRTEWNNPCPRPKEKPKVKKSSQCWKFHQVPRTVPIQTEQGVLPVVGLKLVISGWPFRNNWILQCQLNSSSSLLPRKHQWLNWLNAQKISSKSICSPWEIQVKKNGQTPSSSESVWAWHQGIRAPFLFLSVSHVQTVRQDPPRSHHP